MALLGIYKGEGDKDFGSLRAVHFNLWIVEKKIPEILWDAARFKSMSFYKYFADVGLRLEANDETVAEVDLHLPSAELVTSSFFDLEEKVLDENTNDLIFGRKVESRNNTISFSRDGDEICDTVHGIAKIVKTENSNRFRAVLKSAVTGSGKPTTAYIRFRYEIPQKNDIIAPMGWGFAKKGFTFDLRLNDYREVVKYRGKNQTQNMMIGEEANVFIIHPANYSVVSQCPDPLYLRLLEPQVWGNYLSSCKPFNDKKKFIITQWGSKKFSHEKPFRVFAQLHKEFGLSVAIVYFVGILTVPIVNGLFRLISSYFNG